MLVLDALDEQAPPGIARNDRRPRIAAHKKPIAGIHPQPALLLVHSVTVVTFVGEDRPNVLLEKRYLWLGKVRTKPRSRQQHEQRK
jgi:hypothetical protein